MRRQVMRTAAALAAVCIMCIIGVSPVHPDIHTVSGTFRNYTGDTLSYVEVKLKSGDKVLTYDIDTTDADGFFSVTAEDPVTPQYCLKFRATNAAAKVHPTISAEPRATVTNEFDFVGNEQRNVTVAVVDSVNGKAFWLVGQVYRMRGWFNSETGLMPDKVPIEYPAGAGENKAYYWGGGEGIHIGRNKIRAIYHEYGHFLQDNVPSGDSWINIPWYDDEIPGPGHAACAAQGCVIWPYFEGFAHLVGALGYIDIYGSLDSANVFGDPPQLAEWIEDPSWLEGATIDDFFGNQYVCGTDYWDDPLNTEAAVGAVLFDLVDSYSDSDTTDFGLNEIANMTFEKLWSAVSYYEPDAFERECGTPGQKDHPITLEHFWYAYRTLYPGPVPYLWSAFARNNLDWDTDPPAPPVLSTASHEEGVWKTDNHIIITYVDGADDVSGVFYYQMTFNTNPSTDFYPNPTPSDTTADAPSITFDEYRSSGMYYLHLSGQDLSGKWDGVTTTYGPIQVDVDSPCVVQHFPTGGETFFLYDEIEVEWEAFDDHSGIASVRIEFLDNGVVPGIQLTIADGLPASGTWAWKIPETIGPTSTAFIQIVARDSVGLVSRYCDVTPGLFEIVNVLEPAGGDYDLPPVGPGDLAWADFDADGFDDLAYAGIGPGGLQAEILRSGVYELFPDTTYHLFSHQSLEGLQEGALTWADFDGDGRLDLMTMGLDQTQTTRAHFYFQTTPGVFVHQTTSLGIAGTCLGDVAAGDLDNDGDLDLVVVGRWVGATTAMHFKGYEWDAGSGLFTVRTLHTSVDYTGLENGEVLLIDCDDDGDKDIVYAGQDRQGNHVAGGLRNDGGWIFALMSIPLPLLDNPKLAAGDFTANGLPDVAIIGSPVGSGSSGMVLCNMGGGVWQPDPDITLDVGEGDVTFVDIDNDGDLDVTAVGRSSSSGDLVSQLWINRPSGSMKRELEPVEPYRESSFAWGDVDNDKDLDVVIMGGSSASSAMKLYYNQSSPGRPNTVPDPPENLNASLNQLTGRVVFEWDPPLSQNDQTPDTSLTYDMRVGSSPGSHDIHSGVMPVSNGNTGFGTVHSLALDPGTYYWTVRTVDGGWERSNWAPPQQTTVALIEFVLGDVNGDGDLDVLDVIALANHILGIQVLDRESQQRADCNGDNELDVLDAIAIANVILGIFQECPGDGSCKSVVTAETLEFFKGLGPYFPAEDFTRFMGYVKEAHIPTEYSLRQNYPNPFNPTTTIDYTLPGGERNTENRIQFHTSLKIYNILGQGVRTLVDEIKEAGYYTVTWDGLDENGQTIPSGIYFSRLTIEGTLRGNRDGFTATRRMVLMK